MATVQWNRGPWATARQPVDLPYQTVATPATAPRAPYQALLGDVSGSGLGGTPGAVGPTESGPLGQAGRSVSGYAGIGSRMSGLIGALTGTPALAAIGPAGFPFGIMSLASKISSALGTPNVVDPFAGIRSMDEQAVRDTFGAFAADAIARDRAIAEAGLRGAGPSSYSETVAGAPSVANPDIDTTQEGWGSNQRSMDSGDHGGVDSGGSPDTGTGGMSEGGAARGGVFKTKPRRPKTITFGEDEASEEGETGIFVPEYMKRKGFQGRERQVRRGLKSAYSSLTGDRGKR